MLSANNGHRPSAPPTPNTLDELTAPEFRLVVPFGFVLDKAQWLDRYLSGSFETRSLTWDEVEVRDFGPTAIAIGRHTQEAAYQGQPVDGQFRATHVLVRDGGQWKLAGMHLSQLGLPGGAPGSQPGGQPERPNS